MAERSRLQQNMHARRGQHPQAGQINKHRQTISKRIKRIIEPSHRVRDEIPANDHDATPITDPRCH
jgi:hypothetical protein